MLLFQIKIVVSKNVPNQPTFDNSCYLYLIKKTYSNFLGISSKYLRNSFNLKKGNFDQFFDVEDYIGLTQ